MIKAGVIDAYSFMSPMIDSDQYIKWIEHECISAGVEFHKAKIYENLVANEKKYLDQYNSTWLINCAGLAANITAAD